MAAPLFHHRTSRFRDLLAELTAGLQRVLRTDNDVLVVAGSGTSGMEAAMTSACPRGRTLLSANGGKFGRRWGQLGRRLGIEVDEVQLEWGRAIEPETVRRKLADGNVGAVVVVHSETSTATACDLEAISAEVAKTDAILIADCITSAGTIPVETDAWGVDIVAIGSQKALMTPPGLAVLAVSDKAWRVIEANEPPTVYLDLRAYRQSLAEFDTPFTPATSLVRAMNEAVKYINAQGIETIWQRTALLAEATRAAAGELGLEVFSSQPSDSLTMLTDPAGQADEIRTTLRERYGAIVAGGQGHMKGKAFRISHMGYIDAMDTLGLIAAVEWTLARMGRGPEQPGRAVQAASTILSNWE
jgi:aspartate aminotransferase-like enzyme